MNFLWFILWFRRTWATEYTNLWMLRSSQVSPRSRFVVCHRIKIIQICPIVQVASWGIIKMNDYLVSGTRQQYWEEFFVKHVMSVSLFFFLHLSSATEGHLKPNVAATFFFWGTPIVRCFKMSNTHGPIKVTFKIRRKDHLKWKSDEKN